MSDTTQGAPAPKKRSLFKRAAWQDSPKTDEDIFSHSKDFKYIVAEQHRVEAEKKKKAEEERKRKLAGHGDKKRRKVSNDHDECVLPSSGSGSSRHANRTGSKARSRTPLSPETSHALPDSPSSRYDAFAKSPSSSRISRNTPVVIDLGDSDDDGHNYDAGYNSKSFNSNSVLDYSSHSQSMAMRSSKHAVSDDDDDDIEEQLDPTLAALAARARARAVEKEKEAAIAAANGEVKKAPVVQLFIRPRIPDSRPLMVKVRTDHTLERTRMAWCGKQGYTSAQTKDVFFTWRGDRVYDSTTVKRLGIEVDQFGQITVEGDLDLYDDVNLPKVYVEAWTNQVFQQHKKEEADAIAAKRKAAELLLLPERTPTPEPTPKVKKWRLILKAKGKPDFKLSVNPDSTFGHIANAYKQARGVDEAQPITLIFDGERLVPMDVISDSEIEDLDSIDVLFK